MVRTFTTIRRFFSSRLVNHSYTTAIGDRCLLKPYSKIESSRAPLVSLSIKWMSTNNNDRNHDIEMKQQEDRRRKSTNDDESSQCDYDRYWHPNIIDVSELAHKMRENVRRYTNSINSKIKLVGVMTTSPSLSDDAAETYSDHISETLHEDGIEYEKIYVKKEFDNIVRTIREINERDDVDGILVFYPIFTPSDEQDQEVLYMDKSTGVHYKSHDDYIRDVVSPEKDVEGLSLRNRRNSNIGDDTEGIDTRFLFRKRGLNHELDFDENKNNNEEYHSIPCTALSVQKCIEHYLQKDLSGKSVTIMNRSEIFGHPLAALLSYQNNAHVYSVDHRPLILEFEQGGQHVHAVKATKYSSKNHCLQKSDVVVTGVPCPDFLLEGNQIRDDSLIINVSEFRNVDEESILKRNAKIIPCIGKVTVAALEMNLIQLHQKKLIQNEKDGESK